MIEGLWVKNQIGQWLFQWKGVFLGDDEELNVLLEFWNCIGFFYFYLFCFERIWNRELFRFQFMLCQLKGDFIYKLN